MSVLEGLFRILDEKHGRRARFLTQKKWDVGLVRRGKCIHDTWGNFFKVRYTKAKCNSLYNLSKILKKIQNFDFFSRIHTSVVNISSLAKTDRLPTSATGNCANG